MAAALFEGSTFHLWVAVAMEAATDATSGPAAALRQLSDCDRPACGALQVRFASDKLAAASLLVAEARRGVKAVDARRAQEVQAQPLDGPPILVVRLVPLLAGVPVGMQHRMRGAPGLLLATPNPAAPPCAAGVSAACCCPGNAARDACGVQCWCCRQ